MFRPNHSRFVTLFTSQNHCLCLRRPFTVLDVQSGMSMSSLVHSASVASSSFDRSVSARASTCLASSRSAPCL